MTTGKVDILFIFGRLHADRVVKIEHPMEHANIKYAGMVWEDRSVKLNDSEY